MASETHDSQNRPEANLLLTGCTGFLGKVILENILRTNPKGHHPKIILVIRPRKGLSATQRFTKEVAESLCFSRLNPEWTQNIEVLSADLTVPNWGLSEKDREDLRRKVTHIIHSAASIDFNLPLMDATRANIATALSVVDFATGCRQLASIVCVSTAYVHPHRQGPLQEELVPLPFDPDTLYKRIQSAQISQEAILRETAHPNTYTLTKCLAEHLIAERCKKLPLTIIRPSIIAASLKHPFPGWIDSHAALAAFIAAYGSGLMRVVAADREAKLDVVPVDLVADLITRACFMPKSPATSPTIVQAVVGLDHAIKIAHIQKSLESYFKAHPASRTPHFRRVDVFTPKLKYSHLVHNQVPLYLSQGLAFVRGKPSFARRMIKLRQIMDATFHQFTYFTHRSFDFQKIREDTVVYDESIYLHLICQGVHQYLLGGNPSRHLLFSKDQSTKAMRSKPFPMVDLRSYVAAALFSAKKKLLSSLCNEISVDLASFQRALLSIQAGARIIIAPTCRSHLDFPLCMWFFATHPELGISVPQIIPADHMEILHRFLSREKIFRSKQPLLIFPEERFILQSSIPSPNKQILKWVRSGSEQWHILPVTISYDLIPEESYILRHIKGQKKANNNVIQSLREIGSFVKTSGNLGTIHMTCGDPVRMGPDDSLDGVAEDIAREWHRAMPVSAHHIACYVKTHPRRGLTSEGVIMELRRKGVTVVPSRMQSNHEHLLDPMRNKFYSEKWIAHLCD